MLTVEQKAVELGRSSFGPLIANLVEAAEDFPPGRNGHRSALPDRRASSSGSRPQRVDTPRRIRVFR